MQQKWLKGDGFRDPGLIMCWPFWNKISHVVTRQSRTYNAPVKDCATEDNVMVEIDLSLTFQISDPYKFVYSLGAHRFDELLFAETEEGIRAMVHGVTAMRVHDLREEFAVGMKTGLNETFSAYGVTIQTVKIKKATLPLKLEKVREDTTAFSTEMEQEEKEHANEMRKIKDAAKQRLLKIDEKITRGLQDLEAQKRRALIEREELIVSALSEQEVKKLNAESAAAVAVREAEAARDLAAVNGEKDKAAVVMHVNAELEATKAKISQEMEALVVESRAELVAAENEAKGKLAEAEVEARASEFLKEEREFELESARYGVLERLAKQGRYVVGGKTGEAMLKHLCPGGEFDLSAGVGVEK